MLNAAEYLVGKFISTLTISEQALGREVMRIETVQSLYKLQSLCY